MQACNDIYAPLIEECFVAEIATIQFRLFLLHILHCGTILSHNVQCFQKSEIALTVLKMVHLCVTPRMTILYQSINHLSRSCHCWQMASTTWLWVEPRNPPRWFRAAWWARQLSLRVDSLAMRQVVWGYILPIAGPKQNLWPDLTFCIWQSIYRTSVNYSTSPGR